MVWGVLECLGNREAGSAHSVGWRGGGARRHQTGGTGEGLARGRVGAGAQLGSQAAGRAGSGAGMDSPNCMSGLREKVEGLC